MRPGSPLRDQGAVRMCVEVRICFSSVATRLTLGVISPLTNSGRGIQGYSFPSIVLRVLHKQQIGKRLPPSIEVRTGAPRHLAGESARAEDRDHGRLERALCD